MPSPATPHRPANRGGSAKSTPTKPLDIGQPLGVHDTNSVRSRVRQWQQQGGGVITINDGVYDDDDSENHVKGKPKVAKGKLDQLEKSDKEMSDKGKPVKGKPDKGKPDKEKPDKEKPYKEKSDKENSDKEKEKTKEKLNEKLPAVRKRSHSTPRKRVISDEHWRKNRSTQTPSRNLPIPRRINEYTTNQDSGSPRAKRDKKDTLDKTRDPPKFGAYRDDGAPRSPTREWKRSSARKDADSVAGSDLETDRPSQSIVTSEIPERQNGNSPPPEEIDWAKSEADFSELSRRRARGPQKPPKGGILAHMLDESRKMFKLPEPEPPKPSPPPTGTRGEKIEAWLSETPDPFVDNVNPKNDMPGPLDIKSARARRSQRMVDEIAASNPMSELSQESEPRPRSSDSRPKSSHSRHSKEQGDAPSSEKSRKSHECGMDTVEKPLALKIRQDKDQLRDKPYEDSLAPSESDFQPFSDGGSEVSGNNAPVPVGRKKPFPSTGYHRLSTIASVETLSTLPEGSTLSEKVADKKSKPQTVEQLEEAAEEKDQFDPDSLPAVSSQLQRRLTTHKDLMSVLSGPVSRSGSTRSRRSIRSNRSRLANATIPDLLAELTADETKYMRELKTLVGGVIPVLLTCVLSRSDSAIAAGLFRPSMDPKDDLNFSKPIVNMGVAIERLKTLHKRIPQDNADALLTWAQGAQRVYREYLKAWRLGFKDVIVNLAPLEEGDEGDSAETKSLDEGMERDEHGDVIGSDGEKVDVAYLLKRPLVRLKYLAKSFKGINHLQPSAKAEEIATAYSSLVADARKRARAERARLEDESAASIDSTRARDPMTLGLSRNVTVDQTRRVRARDFFNLSLYHSSGQLVDCRAELLYRDNTSGNGPGGDLLICEIDHSDRWLLFPPMDLRCVSARNGDSQGEIVVMLRSAPEEEKYWQELISLRIDEVEIGLEWVQLLGQDPIPPTLCRSQSFISRAKQHKARKPSASDSPPRTNPSDIDIPIGEKAVSKRRSLTPKEHYSEPSTVSSSVTENRSSIVSTATRETEYTAGGSETSSKQAARSGLPLLPSTISPEKSPGGLKRSKAKRHSRHADSPASETVSPKPVGSGQLVESPAPLPAGGRFYGGDDAAKKTASPQDKFTQKAPQTPRQKESPERESPRVSLTPSAYLPVIPKIRSTSSQTHLSSPSTIEPGEEEDYPPLESLPGQESPETPTKSSRRRSRRKSKHQDAPPPPPPHRSPSSSANKLSNTTVLSPSGVLLKRRGSSPLKHEYEPSTASDYSDSDSDASTVRHYTYSSSDYSRSVSDSDSYSSASDEEGEEPELPKPRAFQSTTSDTSSLSPSNSASQGGYRTVPLQPTKSTKAIASIFAWSNKGSWDSLVPDECNIIVSPGLIEAFGMSSDSDSSSPNRTPRSSRPLISMELTPLVPIRRGTAIDISIRSPPTNRSKITSSNNIMFRSRCPDECDALYSLINQARINNPTYIALQNARGPVYDNHMPTFEQPAGKAEGSWFGFPRRRKSYRASDSPRSLAEGSESSVGTMSSAFSALKRFGGGNKMFNISRSTVTSRSGREGSIYSGSGDSSNPSPSSGIGRIAAAIKGADGIGLSNAKIRIYLRETASKWRDMGAARLTIMPAPPKNPPSRPGTAVSGRSEGSRDDDSSSPPSSGAATPRRDADPEKRIIIRGKTRGEVLLDVCLPESAFERIARTGIAVSVYEENEGGAIAKQGGVGTTTQRIYMIQMKSEAEATYTFGLVGKLRY
ncbi:uncharacterized protein N7482_006201 [Penicillium canariense]|uniref:Uncharacterized protein n=1 Tax=Penicillium canariense TaxID=189055 RepID=A0A9W9I6C4_9EURO|nr:uncharacterized protein N7482_006201 [Penicillium canariense]KAJ5167420.1 hypothetical protein N7482_006201 [Penicillium canariense]